MSRAQENLSIMTTQPTKNSNTFLHSLNYFRALSIILIVMVHVYDISPIYIGWRIPDLVSTFLHTTTVFFIFISGFLFHHIFSKRFNYKRFISNKIKNVYLAYLFLSTLLIIIYSLRGEWHLLHIDTYAGDFGEFLIEIADIYLKGKALTPYWYIPFIMIVFALSPLFMKFLNLKIKWQLGIILIGLILSAMIHRPLFPQQIMQAFFYFIPIYLIGITASQHKDWIYAKIGGGKEYFLLLLGIIILFVQVFVFNHVGNSGKPALEVGYFDMMLLQKLCFVFFFMIILHKSDTRTHKPITWLNRLAEASFAIYFLHYIVLYLFAETIGKLPTNNSYGFIILTVAVILLSYVLGLIIKTAFPKFSRKLIGW